MVIFLFNHYFPDNSGFGKRCQREVELLSSLDKVVIICRKKDNESAHEYYPYSDKKIEIYRFHIKPKVTERPKHYFGGIGLYELARNVRLSIGLIKILRYVILKYKTDKLKFYCVTSPLTIPLIGIILSKIYHIRCECVEFHDLEPEMAMHIKKLPEDHFIVRLEYYLEKLICRNFNKVIVTNETQKLYLVTRNGINLDKVFVYPNLPAKESNCPQKKVDYINKYKLKKSDFILGYVSSLTYDYTINGLLEILDVLQEIVLKIPNLKLMIVGDGDGLLLIKEKVIKKNLQQYVIFTGRITDIKSITGLFNLALIPYARDKFSDTILPTKFFEYLEAKKLILAAKTGELSKAITHLKTGLLYNSPKQFADSLLFIYKNWHIARQIIDNAYLDYLNKYDEKKYQKRFTKFLEDYENI